MASKRREQLLEAAEDQDSFSEIIKQHDEGLFSLGEVLQGMTQSAQTSLWASLEKHIPAKFDADRDTGFCEGLAKFGSFALQQGSLSILDSMKGAVQKLHDNLLDMEFESTAQDAVARFCESWFSMDCPSKREVVPQTILYLLMRSVGDKGKLADVKRVHSMREGLLDIEIADESFRSVQEFIMRAAIHPHYVLYDDGRRFLAFILSLDLHLTRLIHRTIKGQIPYCRASMLSGYGEVYHAAWKRSAGPVLHVLEHECVQDFANHAIHAATPALAANIRKVLAGLHRHKKYKAVDELLFRVYQPILWPALKVASAPVRRQAALLFAEAFPVQDPDAPNADFERSLNEQIKALDDLIKDPSPDVREVGVQCVSRVLSLFFDMLPVHTSAGFVGQLVQLLAFDAASPAVRAATLRGLAFVLDNHLTHPLLKARLPLLRDAVHDKSERVRVAMADLLLKIRSVHAIRFFDVVPMDDILLRLATDATRPAVASKLTALLTPSFLPINKPPPELLTRAMTMIRKSPQAAAVFYREAGASSPEQVAVNLLVTLHHALMVCVHKKRAGDAAAVSTKPKRKQGRDTPQRAGGRRRSERGQKAAAGADDDEEDLEKSALLALTGADDDGDEEDLEKSALLALLDDEDEDEESKYSDGADGEVVQDEDEGQEEEGEDQQTEALAALAVGEAEEFSAVALQMLQVMAALMSTLQRRLQAEECAQMRKYLADSLPASSIPILAETFDSPAARSALWRLAAALPEPATDEVCRECLARLHAMRPDDRGEEAGPLIDCLVAWGRHKPLLRSICAGVASLLAASDDAGKGKGKEKRAKKTAARKAAGAEGSASGWADDELALWCAHRVLCSDAARSKLMQTPSQLEGLVTTFASAVALLQDRVATGERGPGPRDEVLLEVLVVYGKLCLHAHCAELPGSDGTGTGTAPHKVTELLAAVSDGVVPSLVARHAQADDKSPHAKAARGGLAGGGVGGGLGWQACRVALMIASESCTLNRSDERLAVEMARLAAGVVEQQKGCAELDAGVLHAVCKATYQLLRLGLAGEEARAVLGEVMTAMPEENLRGVAQLLKESLSLAARSDATGTSPGEGGARALLGACLQRAQREAQLDREQEVGEERNAAVMTLVEAARKGGADVQAMLSRELAAMITCPSDLSALQAALGMAEAMLNTKPAKSGARPGEQDVRRAVTGVLQTLREQPAKLAPGPNACNAHEVAAMAETLTASG